MSQVKTAGIDKEQLKREVLEELERDELKGEIVRELKPAPEKGGLSKGLQHPLVLLVVGFIMTGVVVQFLASSWQSREWNRQQTRLAQLREVDQKYEVINEVNKALAEINAAENSVLRLFTNSLRADELTTEERERETNWGQAKKNWDVASGVLRQKVAVHFKDRQALALFDMIVSRKQEIHSYIEDMPSDSSRRVVGRQIKKLFKEENSKGFRIGLDEDLIKSLNGAGERAVDVTTYHNSMLEIMINEIRAGLKGELEG